MTLVHRSPVLVLVLAVVLSSCGKDDEPTGPVAGAPPAELVGTWSMQSATLNGQPVDLGTVLNWAANTVSAEFTVQQSGVYTYQELDGQGFPTFLAAGTITVNGASFTISVTSVNGTPVPAQRQSGTWELVQGELRLTTEQDVGGTTGTVVVRCVRK